jgi:hypothetical protein
MTVLAAATYTLMLYFGCGGDTTVCGSPPRVELCQSGNVPGLLVRCDKGNAASTDPAPVNLPDLATCATAAKGILDPASNPLLPGSKSFRTIRTYQCIRH